MSIETLFAVVTSSFARATVRGAATRLAAGITLASLTACGVFGKEDPASSAPAGSSDMTPTPSNATPADNAMAPAVGGPAATTGVFVSASHGADDGTGTATHPLKSLNAAFALAQSKNLQVIVCAEEYAENIVVLNGVSAYGNYDCSQSPWVSSATLRAVVRAPNSPAVVAKSITLPTRFDGFELRSPDLAQVTASDDTASSIALDVRDSTAFVLSHSLVHAGSGAAGADGTDGAVNTQTGTLGAHAQDQNYRTCPGDPALCFFRTVPGTAGGTTTCSIGPSGGPGGQGGSGRWFTDPTSPVAGWTGNGYPAAATSATAAGGTYDGILPARLTGRSGAAGADGSDGANGAWSLTAAGFVRGNGSAGTAGSPGQGGGGGAGTPSWYATGTGAPTTAAAGSSYSATATGAGGGAGGCAGQAGTPATGGGASIGALVIDSTAALEHVVVETSAGGKAGKGNLGTPGNEGTLGGTGIFVAVRTGVLIQDVVITGDGGNGGSGGSGGASGHGAAGPSIAIAFSKTAPNMTDATLKPGAGGAGQPALTRDAKTLPAVADGESLETYEIKQ